MTRSFLHRRRRDGRTSAPGHLGGGLSAALVVASLVLVGCGSDDEVAAPAPSRAAEDELPAAPDDEPEDGTALEAAVETTDDGPGAEVEEALDVELDDGGERPDTGVGGDPPDAEAAQDVAGYADYAVPGDLDDVDAAYVDAVMNRILEGYAQLMAEALDVERTLEEYGSRGQDHRVGDLASGPQRALWMEEMGSFAFDDRVREQLVPREELAPPTWETHVIREVETGCIVAIGTYDMSGIAIDPLSTDIGVGVSLSRFDHASEEITSQDPVTPWVVHDMRLAITGDDEPIPREHWEDVGYGEVLATTCGDEVAEPRERS